MELCDQFNPKIGDEHLKWQLEAAYSIVETKHLSIDCHVPPR